MQVSCNHVAVDAATMEDVSLDVEFDLHGLTVRLPNGSYVVLDVSNRNVTVGFAVSESSDVQNLARKSLT